MTIEPLLNSNNAADIPISRSLPVLFIDSGIYCSELCKFPLRCLLQKFDLRLREIGEARGQEIL